MGVFRKNASFNVKSVLYERESSNGDPPLKPPEKQSNHIHSLLAQLNSLTKNLNYIPNTHSQAPTSSNQLPKPINHQNQTQSSAQLKLPSHLSTRSLGHMDCPLRHRSLRYLVGEHQNWKCIEWSIGEYTCRPCCQ